jgi:hypothetical protein
MLVAVSGVLVGQGACALDSGFHVSDPFDYCGRVGTSDHVFGAGGDPSGATGRVLQPYLRAALELPEGSMLPAGTVFWRCMQGKVYVCAVGANLPCGSKADRARRNSGAANYCRDNPTAIDVPAFATGRETIYSWRCVDGKAVPGAPIADLDRRGFRRDIWHVVTR